METGVYYQLLAKAASRIEQLHGVTPEMLDALSLIEQGCADDPSWVAANQGCEHCHGRELLMAYPGSDRYPDINFVVDAIAEREGLGRLDEDQRAKRLTEIRRDVMSYQATCKQERENRFERLRYQIAVLSVAKHHPLLSRLTHCQFARIQELEEELQPLLWERCIELEQAAVPPSWDPFPAGSAPAHSQATAEPNLAQVVDHSDPGQPA